MTVRPSSRTRLAAVLAAAAVGATGACSTATATSVPTVTVTVLPGAGGTPGAGGSPSGSIDTGTQPGPATGHPAALPTKLAVGHQRGAPHSFAEARARLARAKVDGRVHGTFRSPSGNIACDVSNSATIARCILDAGRVEVPARLCPGDGTDRVRGVELTDTGAFPVCEGQVAAAEQAPKLPYGSRTVVPDSPFTCLSELVGVTCVDTDYERGFFLAKNTFVTF